MKLRYTMKKEAKKKSLSEFLSTLKINIMKTYVTKSITLFLLVVDVIFSFISTLIKQANDVQSSVLDYLIFISLFLNSKP